MSEQPQGSAAPGITEAPPASEQVIAQAPLAVAQPNVGGDNYKCEWEGCNEQLPGPTELYEHVCERHVGRKSTNNLTLQCKWGACRTVTVKRDHITSHIRVHIPLKPHKCPTCQKAFKRPQDLKKHVKTHAEDTHQYQTPEPSRHGQAGGASYGGAGPRGASADHFYGNQHMHGQPGGYQPYTNGNGNHSAYPGASYNQGNYQATTFYNQPMASPMNTEYEVRKRATYDALNEFFGDIKSHRIDPGQVQAVGQRLMTLQHLPQYAGGADYEAGTAVASSGHQPLTNHYSLPNTHIRTKVDLQNIDHFLQELQTQVYAQESAAHAAQAGVAQAGVHAIPVGYRTSQSPPHALPPLTSAANETPALTPASSVVSYHSPGSVHSSTISPVSRGNVGGSMYPSLPSMSTGAEITSSYPATSGALPSTLGPAFDLDGRRRFSGGQLQQSAPDRKMSRSPDTMPAISKMTVRSPVPHNVDPALYGGETTPRARSAEPATGGSEHGGETRLVDVMRIAEFLQKMVQNRLEAGEYSDEEEETTHESEARREVGDLYPILQAVKEDSA